MRNAHKLLASRTLSTSYRIVVTWTTFTCIGLACVHHSVLATVWAIFQESARYRMAESMSNKDGCLTFVCIYQRCFQVPQNFISDCIGKVTKAQPLIMTAVKNWAIRGRSWTFDVDVSLRLCQCHIAAGFGYVDDGRSDGKHKCSIDWNLFASWRRARHSLGRISRCSIFTQKQSVLAVVISGLFPS